MLFLALNIGLIYGMVSCSGDEGDSCGQVKVMNYSVDSTIIYIDILSNSNANSTRVEYGPAGFTQGTGTSFVTSNSNIVIDNLNPSTTYDVYFTGVCDTEHTSKVTPLKSVTTAQKICTGTVTADFSQFYSPTSMDVYMYYNNSSPSYYIVEYGVSGFALGSGTKVQTGTSSPYLTIDNLQPSTAYDFYIKAVCWEGAPNDTSENVKYTKTTIVGCPKPTNLGYTTLSGSCNSGSGATRHMTWADPYNANNYTVCIVEQGGTPSMAGTTFDTSNKSITISNMYCLWDAFYVRANCGGGTTSEWAGPYYF